MNKSQLFLGLVTVTGVSLAVAFVAGAGAPSLDGRVDAAVQRFAPEAIEIRHHVHQNPELGNRERKTADLVAERLRALGLEPTTGIAHTGVVAVLKGGQPGPFVAVRADMDALPVIEDTRLPFKSTVRTTYLGQEVGVAHACGHDIHVAVQIGVASILTSLKDQVPGTVQFIFQPAEEGPPPGEEGGAQLMLKEGLWKEAKPSAVFGLHVNAQSEVGQIRYTPGPTMAAADSFRIVIKGTPAHGARPELAVDPIIVASQAVMALQTIRSRNLRPLDPAVLTVAMIRGGQRQNIIPEEVEMRGTVRTFDGRVQDLIERRMREILEGVTRSAGATYVLEYERGYPVTVNDRALTSATLPSLVRAVGEKNLLLDEPRTGAEDFSFLAGETPGFFYFLGGLKPGTTSGDHHTPTFLVDDAAIPVGMRAMSYVLLDYLAREAGKKPAPR
jgi:amidohydrolase